MRKCKAINCGHEAEWAWQPFGPGEDVNCLTLPGSHYRGFPTVAVCEECKDKVAEGSPPQFEYRKDIYVVFEDGQVHKSPF